MFDTPWPGPYHQRNLRSARAYLSRYADRRRPRAHPERGPYREGRPRGAGDLFDHQLGAHRRKVVAVAAKKVRESPLAQLYFAAYQELAGSHDLEHFADEGEEASTDRLEAADRAMRRAAGLEVAQLERYLPFLATTASACPFIGLFGTVVGVMNSFHGIGAQGSASLAVVAPGISEALVATAAGLGAAIPAVIGYNYFVNRVKHWATEMDGVVVPDDRRDGG